jgi:holin-like protein
MEIIRQLGLIIGFGYAGELLAFVLPVRLPAGVLGLLLVIAALALGWIKPRHLGATADFISANMAFFFLPLSVAILQNYEAIRPVLLEIVIICLVSTLITFTVSYGTVRILRIALSKKKTMPGEKA